MDRLKLAIIIGSTREGRFAPVVGSWFVDLVEGRDEFEVDVLDLADLRLPPVMAHDDDPVVADYSRRIAAADAFVVVTPEYNHGYPAPLKQAIDLVHAEWQHKAVGFVSYGGISGGLRAVEQLRQVFAELRTVTVRDTVSFHNAWERFDEAGALTDASEAAAAAHVMLDDLAWWADALRSARRARSHAA